MAFQLRPLSTQYLSAYLSAISERIFAVHVVSDAGTGKKKSFQKKKLKNVRDISDGARAEARPQEVTHSTYNNPPIKEAKDY